MDNVHMTLLAALNSKHSHATIFDRQIHMLQVSFVLQMNIIDYLESASWVRQNLHSERSLKYI